MSSDHIDALKSYVAGEIGTIHTSTPGRVLKYDYKTQKANISPLIQRKKLDGSFEDMPVLTDVPIIFPGNKKTSITFPVNKGDDVLVVFCERPIGNYLASGDISEPDTTQTYSLTDAVAYPGMFNYKRESLAKNNEDCQIMHEGQVITIKKNGDIEIGGKDLLALVNENFKDTFEGHTHGVPVAAQGTPVLSAPPSSDPAGIVPILMGSSEFTSKVKAE